MLVNPRVPLSTREVYGRVPAGWRAEPTGTERVIEALRTRNVATLAAALTNNLERVVEPVLPVIGRMKAALLAAGALGAIMSGSGPTVFGMARSLDHARQIRVAGEPGGLGLLGGPHELGPGDPGEHDDWHWGVVQWQDSGLWTPQWRFDSSRPSHVRLAR